MFERYTEEARRTIFWARYSVNDLRSNCIEPEHILLGLLKEDDFLVPSLLNVSTSSENIYNHLMAGIPKGNCNDIAADVPMSADAYQILRLADKESRKMSDRHIGTEHLLLGILGVKGTLAEQLLDKNGITDSEIRQKLRNQKAIKPKS